jgi:hypothetical protein
VQDICLSQRPYLEAEKSLPALPDCVFAFKRSKRIKVRKGSKPKHQKKNIDLVQEEHINSVDLATEELPTIPQVVVIDLTMDPF